MNQTIKPWQLVVGGLICWVIGAFLQDSMGDTAEIYGMGIVILGHIMLAVGIIQGAINLFKK